MSDKQQSADVVSDDSLNGWLVNVSVKMGRDEAGKVIYQVTGGTAIEDVRDELHEFGARLMEHCTWACIEKFGVKGVNNYGN
ncbi:MULTISPECIES: hypothetical protein [unclassified Pantoea]|nr:MULTISPECIES: hypothetical protein [unclassified Pantoea]KAA5957777.1 hypothetical protein F3I53_16130 [Pantoea sp. VH_16]KAA6104665.1 hypothetical protein F3I25_16320 [Pantoea sp. Bo_14]KAA6108041.1 hypothetical protein F3I23_15355 [Pantoea sp. Bo_11]